MIVEVRLSAAELTEAMPDVTEVFRLIREAQSNVEVRKAGVPVELRDRVGLAVRRVLAQRDEPFEWDGGWDFDGTMVHLWIREEGNA